MIIILLKAKGRGIFDKCLLFFFVILFACSSEPSYDSKPELEGKVLQKFESNTILFQIEKGSIEAKEILLSVEGASLEVGAVYQVWLEGEILDSQPPQGRSGKIVKVNDR
jgi:hypothetical protein